MSSPTKTSYKCRQLNVLLSSDPNAPDSKQGFLTDVDSAQIEDEILETEDTTSIPSVRAITSPSRGAVLADTIQFMAGEPVSSIAFQCQSQIIHRVYHDAESFIWVMYYDILRRIGRVLTMGAIPAELPKIFRITFQKIFGHADQEMIAEKRLSVPFPSSVIWNFAPADLPRFRMLRSALEHSEWGQVLWSKIPDY